MKTDKVVLIFQKLFSDETIVSVDKKRGNEHDVVEINERWICKSAKTKEMQDVIAREVALLRSLEGKMKTARDIKMRLQMIVLFDLMEEQHA